jgi:hypothetical protein
MTDRPLTNQPESTPDDPVSFPEPEQVLELPGETRQAIWRYSMDRARESGGPDIEELQIMHEQLGIGRIGRKLLVKQIRPTSPNPTPGPNRKERRDRVKSAKRTLRPILIAGKRLQHQWAVDQEKIRWRTTKKRGAAE